VHLVTHLSYFFRRDQPPPPSVYPTNRDRFQEMQLVFSALLGVATGLDLAELCCDGYPTWARMVLWVMAEFFLIGSDIQELIEAQVVETRTEAKKKLGE
ncbi:predicted protein, partial [Arabidopsis lyrata subsp. lyrata]